MIRQLFIFIFLCIFFVACNSNKEENQLQSVIASFNNLNKLVEKENNLIRDGIMDKTRNIATVAVATPILSKVENILQVANRSKKQINLFKRQIAGDSVEQGLILFDTLLACKKAMLRILKPGTDNYGNSLPFLPGLPGAIKTDLQQYRKNWVDSIFANNNKVMSQLMLTKLENDLVVSVKMIGEYYRTSIVHHLLICNKIFPVATISSSFVQAGENIEVNAGVQNLETLVNAKIYIDGKLMILLEDAMAAYSFKAKKKPGKYAVPVSIEWRREDGNIVSVNKNLTYTVAQ